MLAISTDGLDFASFYPYKRIFLSYFFIVLFLGLVFLFFLKIRGEVTSLISKAMQSMGGLFTEAG